MKRTILFVVLAFFAASNSFVRAEVLDALGSQTVGSAAKGTSLKSDPIQVGKEGVVILEYKATCTQTVWLEKESKGSRSTFKKFYDLKKLKNFVIDQEGTYFIYPVPAKNCRRATISIKYKTLDE